MATAGDQESALLRDVVRGERPLGDLARAGLSLLRNGNACRVENPRGVSTSADAADLAAGILAHRNDLESLREWAMFVTCSDVEVTAERHPDGETVLGALWDASFGNPISPDVFEVLKHVAGEKRRSA
jgi:hypothetical protein